MNYLDDPQRQQILTGTLAARTPEQLITATRELDTWVAMHLDDKGINGLMSRWRLSNSLCRRQPLLATRSLI